MWDLEDRLRDLLAEVSESVNPRPDGLGQIRHRVACQHEAQERLALDLGIAYGPATARLIFTVAAFCAKTIGRPAVADFWSATADLLTHDMQKPPTPHAEGSCPPAPTTPKDG
jgi:hypothetical protein